MQHTGHFNPAFPIETTRINGAQEVHYNLNAAQLFEMSIKLDEGMVTDSGALAVITGKHTGRSAQDKFIVRDASTEDTIWWDNNKGMSADHFATLKTDFLDHAKGKRLFVQDLYGGADADHRIKVRVVTQFAWHALFIRYLLRRPSRAEVMQFTPELTIINQPSFKADPARHGSRTETVIAINLAEKLVLIADSEYAGETKKSVFGTLNYFLPEKGIMPMHCSANAGMMAPLPCSSACRVPARPHCHRIATRTLVGDDEHGWSPNGIFNFEGGCYAKTVNLSAEAEPEIYAPPALGSRSSKTSWSMQTPESRTLMMCR